MHSDNPLRELEQALDAGGLRAGLAMLNARVPHRFTVVYRFDGKAFYGMVVIDKQGEPPPLFDCVPFVDSFCQYTVGEGVFRTENSIQDRRLDGHIHQANVQCYVGLPLTDSTGDLYGTFCHLDFVPQPVDDAEFAFMEKAVRLLAGHVPAGGVTATA